MYTHTHMCLSLCLGACGGCFDGRGRAVSFPPAIAVFQLGQRKTLLRLIKLHSPDVFPLWSLFNFSQAEEQQEQQQQQ